MSLTANDVTLLRESWAELSKLGLQEVGMQILFRLLDTVPEVRPLFYKVIMHDMQINLESMRKEPKVRSHALRIGTSLSNLMKNLESPDEFNEILRNLGLSHHKLNVDPKYFEDMEIVILYVVSTVQKLDMESEKMKAWKKAYGAIKHGIVAAMQ